MSELETRVAKLVEWTEDRIHRCRRVEANLGYSDDAIAAATERIVLMQVLTMLGREIPPRDEADLKYRGTGAAMIPPRRTRGRKIA